MKTSFLRVVIYFWLVSLINSGHIKGNKKSVTLNCNGFLNFVNLFRCYWAANTIHCTSKAYIISGGSFIHKSSHTGA